jgi:DNA-binding HxlR family transcriptional regulator
MKTKKDSGTKELIKREEIPNSPFHVITIKGESFGVMGDYRLTEKGESAEEIKKELSKITWNRIVQVIMLLEEVKTKINNKIKEKL